MNRLKTAIVTPMLALALGCNGSSNGNDPDGGDGNPTGTDTETEQVCPPDRVDDPSFEDGSPNMYWDEESYLYDNVICDTSCIQDGGVEPRTGSYMVWFGGIAETEVARVEQTLHLPQGLARVRFWLGIDTGPLRNGDDVLEVQLNDTVVFSVTEAETDDYPLYTEINEVVPVAAGAQVLSFEADLTGNHLTSFFIDDVSVTVCADPNQPPPDGGDTSDDGTGGTGSDDDTDTSVTSGTGTDTGTGGSDDTGTDTSGTGTGGTTSS
jgi:hypothetical protein